MKVNATAVELQAFKGQEQLGKSRQAQLAASMVLSKSLPRKSQQTSSSVEFASGRQKNERGRIDSQELKNLLNCVRKGQAEGSARAPVKTLLESRLAMIGEIQQKCSSSKSETSSLTLTPDSSCADLAAASSGTSDNGEMSSEAPAHEYLDTLPSWLQGQAHVAACRNSLQAKGSAYLSATAGSMSPTLVSMRSKQRLRGQMAGPPGERHCCLGTSPTGSVQQLQQWSQSAVSDEWSHSTAIAVGAGMGPLVSTSMLDVPWKLEAEVAWSVDPSENWQHMSFWDASYGARNLVTEAAAAWPAESSRAKFHAADEPMKVDLPVWAASSGFVRRPPGL